MTHEQAVFDAKTEIDFVIIGAGQRRGVGRYDALREAAFTYSFMLCQWGIAK